MSETGDEFVGLAGGLLEVGAPAVVAGLWAVADVSTAFLMDRFYELWLGRDGREQYSIALDCCGSSARGLLAA
jgi:CHAT domain-containing protein